MKIINWDFIKNYTSYKKLNVLNESDEFNRISIYADDIDNFSESIRSISTEICCDNIVIKESSTVKLYKLNIETTSSELVTTIPYDGSHNNFKYEFCAEETCLYYIIIENN